VLLSGGIDSAACLYWARKRYSAKAITFLYDGIAVTEVKAARRIGREAKAVEHRLVRLPDLREAQDMKSRFEGLPGTYIPMRNAIFYSLAASYAEEVRAKVVIGGHNKDDLCVFRDTSPEFFAQLQKAFLKGSRILDDQELRIERPLSSKTKPQVIRFAKGLGVPFEVTWSCHSDGPDHCWKCQGCLGRAAAFKAAGVKDPLLNNRNAQKVS
jgi:7-cyano-7-deazaguanine synthase